MENVGNRVGYEDLTYFARRFRSTHEENPAAWRTANRWRSTMPSEFDLRLLAQRGGEAKLRGASYSERT